MSTYRMLNKRVKINIEATREQIENLAVSSVDRSVLLVLCDSRESFKSIVKRATCNRSENAFFTPSIHEHRVKRTRWRRKLIPTRTEDAYTRSESLLYSSLPTRRDVCLIVRSDKVEKKKEKRKKKREEVIVIIVTITRSVFRPKREIKRKLIKIKHRKAFRLKKKEEEEGGGIPRFHS